MKIYACWGKQRKTQKAFGSGDILRKKYGFKMSITLKAIVITTRKCIQCMTVTSLIV